MKGASPGGGGGGGMGKRPEGGGAIGAKEGIGPRPLLALQFLKKGDCLNLSSSCITLKTRVQRKSSASWHSLISPFMFMVRLGS